jgi:hypothetical protein
MKTPEELKEEIWRRYGNFELSHDKNELIVNNILEFILKERENIFESQIICEYEYYEALRKLRRPYNKRLLSMEEENIIVKIANKFLM